LETPRNGQVGLPASSTRKTEGNDICLELPRKGNKKWEMIGVVGRKVIQKNSTRVGAGEGQQRWKVSTEEKGKTPEESGGQTIPPAKWDP